MRRGSRMGGGGAMEEAGMKHVAVRDMDMDMLRGFAKNKNSKNPRLLLKWVGGGSRSQSDFFFFFGNHLKIGLNQF